MPDKRKSERSRLIFFHPLCLDGRWSWKKRKRWKEKGEGGTEEIKDVAEEGYEVVDLVCCSTTSYRKRSKRSRLALSVCECKRMIIDNTEITIMLPSVTAGKTIMT